LDFNLHRYGSLFEYGSATETEFSVLQKPVTLLCVF
jgi:hypothetical protein